MRVGLAWLQRYHGVTREGRKGRGSKWRAAAAEAGPELRVPAESSTGVPEKEHRHPAGQGESVRPSRVCVRRVEFSHVLAIYF